MKGFSPSILQLSWCFTRREATIVSNPTSHPCNIKKLAPIGFLLIHLECPWVDRFGVFKLIPVSSEIQKKETYGLHCISWLLCWMNERYMISPQSPSYMRWLATHHGLTLDSMARSSSKVCRWVSNGCCFHD